MLTNIRKGYWVVSLLLVLGACGGGGGGGGTTNAASTGPSISAQPLAASVSNGQTATFSVTASGTGTLGYQWYLNGTAISGATISSYTTPAVTSANSGDSYYVVVSDSSGSVNSSSVKLSVATGTAAPITASQSWATAAVKSANGGVSSIVLSNNAGMLPIGSTMASLPIGATTSNTIPCSTLGSAGSGSMSFVETYDSTTFAPQSFAFTYNNCTWSSAGMSFTIDGTGSYTYSNYVTTPLSFDFTATYNATYSYVYGSYSDSGTFNGSESCSMPSSGAITCNYNFGAYTVGSGAVVTSSGSVTTVSSATTTTTVSGSSGSVTLAYSDWVYDASLGYATSGTVTIADGNGNTATITANGNGTYAVVVTYEGATLSYTV